MNADVPEMRGAMYLAKFLARLTDGGGTYEDLTETGLSYHTCIRYCRALQEFNLAYIDHWEEDGRGVATRPFWKFCLKKTRSAKRPKRTKEQLAAYKRQWRADKNKQSSTSAFNQHVPRYAEGCRVGQGAS